MARKQKRPETLSGGFAAIPWAVLDGEAFQGSTPRAKAMLFEAMRQLDGRNNGHLNLAVSTLRKRGWRSTDAIQAAKGELLARGLVIRTKMGGLNIGPDLYAVTWLTISNFVGLGVGSNQYHPGAWRFVEDLPTPIKRHSRAPEKRNGHSASRNSTVPAHGTGEASTVPPHGTKTGTFSASTVPPHGNNVIHQSPTVNSCLPESVQSFRARIGGKLTVPQRAPCPLGRTRNVRLFTAAYGNLIRHEINAGPKVATVATPPAKPNNGAGVVSELHKKEAAVPKPKRTAGNSRKRIVGKAGKSGKPKSSHATASEPAHLGRHIGASAYASLSAADLGVGMSWAATRC